MQLRQFFAGAEYPCCVAGATEPGENQMKKIILSVAFAALASSQALAQATPMLTQPPAYYAGQRVLPGGHVVRGYAQPGYYASGAVSPDNRIILRDPDPNVQLQLKRDPVSDY